MKCKICGKEFFNEHRRQIYCSPNCQKRAQSLRAIERKKAKANQVKKDNYSEIVRVAKLAREAGLTYGQYVLREGL